MRRKKSSLKLSWSSWMLSPDGTNTHAAHDDRLKIGEQIGLRLGGRRDIEGRCLRVGLCKTFDYRAVPRQRTARPPDRRLGKPKATANTCRPPVSPWWAC